MELFSVLITGANRGIGLEFVKQLVNSPKPPKYVFATYRNKDTIKQLEVIQESAPSDVQVHLVRLDVRRSEDLSNLKKFVENKVGEKGLTMLINNAGAVDPQPYANVTTENLDMHLKVNTFGPVLIAQEFLPLLKKAASLSSDSGMKFSRAGILNMSSKVGSIADTGVHFLADLCVPSYKISKKLEEIQHPAPSAVKVHLVKLDVQSSDDLNNLRRFVEDVVQERGLTLLINNAGMVQRQPFPTITFENLKVHFQVNAVGPVLIAQKFLPLLKKAASSESSSDMELSKACILNISSIAGSISKVGIHTKADFGAVSYKISKAALNMAMRTMAAAQKDDNILIVNMCPGWVKTDMGAARANIYPEESVAAMLNTISKLNETHHGTYVDRFGDPIPW